MELCHHSGKKFSVESQEKKKAVQTENTFIQDLAINKICFGDKIWCLFTCGGAIDDTDDIDDLIETVYQKENKNKPKMSTC